MRAVVVFYKVARLQRAGATWIPIFGIARSTGVATTPRGGVIAGAVCVQGHTHPWHQSCSFSFIIQYWRLHYIVQSLYAFGTNGRREVYQKKKISFELTSFCAHQDEIDFPC